MKTTTAFASVSALPALATAAAGLHVFFQNTWLTVWVLVLITLRLAAPAAYVVICACLPAERARAIDEALRSWRRR